MQVKIEESWRSQLQEEFDKPYFARLAAFVREEYRTQRVCPVNGDLFRVFNLCPFDRVRVVILGQDPYPDPRFYYGICFSVPDGVPIPGSLQNIFREVHDDTGRPVPASGRLERWVAQGVLSMNTIFTTRAFRSGSHRGRGWEEFSDAVIRRLNERRDHLVFLLWGAAAQQKAALNDCRLDGVAFEGCTLRSTEFSHTPLRGIDLRQSQLGDLRLTVDDLRGAIVAPSQALDLLPLLGVVVRTQTAEETE